MAAGSHRRPRYEDLTERQRRIYDFIKDCLLYTSPSPRDRG